MVGDSRACRVSNGASAGQACGEGVHGRRLTPRVDSAPITMSTRKAPSDTPHPRGVLRPLEAPRPVVLRAPGCRTQPVRRDVPALVLHRRAWPDQRERGLLSAPGRRSARSTTTCCGVASDRSPSRRVAQLSARRGGTVTRYEDVALTAVASADMEQARRFVASELGPLAEQDDDMQRLAATLRVYLEEHSSARNSPGRSSEPRSATCFQDPADVPAFDSGRITRAFGRVPRGGRRGRGAHSRARVLW
jgi:hypothetical protein